MPSRRRFLRAGSAAGILALAGCSGRTATEPRANESPIGSPTESPTPTPERLAFGETYDSGDGVTATGASVQSSVRHLSNVDHNGIVAGEQWYLFVTVAASSSGPLPRDFDLRTAEGTYEPLAVRDERLREQMQFVNGDAYRGTGEETTGWLLFEVPYVDPVEDARLVLDGAATWALPDATVQRLRAEPPAFEVRDVEMPDSPAAANPFDVGVTVANDGGAGTFRGAFNYTAPMYSPRGIAREFDAGAERTLSVTVDIHVGRGAAAGDEVAARLVSPDEDLTWSVTLG